MTGARMSCSVQMLIHSYIYIYIYSKLLGGLVITQFFNCAITRPWKSTPLQGRKSVNFYNRSTRVAVVIRSAGRCTGPGSFRPQTKHFQNLFKNVERVGYGQVKRHEGCLGLVLV